MSSHAFLPPAPVRLSARTTTTAPSTRQQHPTQTTASTTQSPPPAPPAPPVAAVAARLRTELPDLFSPGGRSDFSLYDPSVTFEDPLNKFRGAKRYAANISFLNHSPVFTTAALTLYDLAPAYPRPNVVRTRWMLAMTARLPWTPLLAFTGQSDYVVDLSSGKVVRHIDYWDSLADSTFFSTAAVADLLRQCKPGRVDPRCLGGFQLLRRTAALEVRNFAVKGRQGVSLCPSGERRGGAPVWREEEKGEGGESMCVARAAVAPLGGKVLRQVEAELLAELEGAKYARAGEKTHLVEVRVGKNLVPEVWVELEEANAHVDEVGGVGS